VSGRSPRRRRERGEGGQRGDAAARGGDDRDLARDARPPGAGRRPRVGRGGAGAWRGGDPDPLARPPSSRRPAAALALALVAALAVAGVAGALGFRLPGLEIIRVEPAADRGRDEPRLARARGRCDGHRAPAVLAPAAMPEPDAAYVLGAGDREIVTLAWRAAGGEPAIPTSNLSLVAMAIPGTVDEILVTSCSTARPRSRP
jgi:hypothetical protein